MANPSNPQEPATRNGNGLKVAILALLLCAAAIAADIIWLAKPGQATIRATPDAVGVAPDAVLPATGSGYLPAQFPAPAAEPGAQSPTF